MGGTVTVVSSNGEYSFTKPNRDSITLLAGLGVEGDIHAGVTVKHRFSMASPRSTTPTTRSCSSTRSTSSPMALTITEGYDNEAGGVGGRGTTHPRWCNYLHLRSGRRHHVAGKETTASLNPTDPRGSPPPPRKELP